MLRGRSAGQEEDELVTPEAGGEKALAPVGAFGEDGRHEDEGLVAAGMA
ncbi:MAG: hypothetical protein NVS3B12_06420 [Acidimicrobiales bacterium]